MVFGNTLYRICSSHMEKVFEISNLKKHIAFSTRLIKVCIYRVENWTLYVYRHDRRIHNIYTAIATAANRVYWMLYYPSVVRCTCIIYACFTFRMKQQVNDSIFSCKLFSWIHFEFPMVVPAANQLYLIVFAFGIHVIGWSDSCVVHS